MKTIILVILSQLFIIAICSGQKEDSIKLIKNHAQTAYHICKYGDSKRMELHPNKHIYRFKEGLEDGMYTAFFNKKFEKDTAMVVVIKNGKINGLLRRWNPDDYLIEEECEYKDGKMNGYRKLYFYPKEGGCLVNIERWLNNVHQEDVQIVW